ncbi:NACHT domain-containing protein [Streptomyces sp. NPDC048385]|uniref:NACHT domain-containing protein n=1 Tax=unclassified Streptomyces TaxID=2593676 RepID=UPI00343304CF
MARGGGRGDRRWRWVDHAGGWSVGLTLVWAGSVGLVGRYSAPEYAGVLAVPLTVAGVWLAVRAIRGADETDLDKLAEELVAESKRALGSQRRQLLGRWHRPIDLGFRVRNGASPTAAPLARGGDLGDIVAFYRALPTRRLVVTGSPGAGKTFMAIELVLGLLEDRSDSDPVPVRLTLTDWDVDTAFEDWLAEQVAAVYNVRLTGARRLVAARRVLPVLDGLDEMDATSDPRAIPPRAVAAVEALDGYLDGRHAAPLVLTCRSWRYEALVAARGQGLTQSTRVQISPVTADQARAYLDDRRGDQPTPDRWSALLDALGQGRDMLGVGWLSTPWRLIMVATVYAVQGNPAELVDRARDGTAASHLLSLYVPAAIDMHPHGRNDRYRAEDAGRWLAELARYLRDSGKQSIVLHELWGLGRGRWNAVLAGGAGDGSRSNGVGAPLVRSPVVRAGVSGGPERLARFSRLGTGRGCLAGIGPLRPSCSAPSAGGTAVGGGRRIPGQPAHTRHGRGRISRRADGWRGLAVLG